MKHALLVLDPQNDFFGEDNSNLAEFHRVVPIINAAITLFREYNLPVVFVQHTSVKEKAGTHAWEVYRGFDCRLEDVRLTKTQMNAFWKSALESRLKLFKVETVVVAGFTSEYCVLSTARGASERGFQSTILKDGIASLDNARTQFVYDISACISLDELREQLAQESATSR